VNFTEYDGMILSQSAKTAEINVQKQKEEGFWSSRWAYERVANSVRCASSETDREYMRKETAIIERFATDLRQAYPNRSFVMMHIPCLVVSFYQAMEDASRQGVLPEKDLLPAGLAWCQTCRSNRLYTFLPGPDAEFPQVEWGRCTVCGNDVIIHQWEILTLLPASGP